MSYTLESFITDCRNCISKKKSPSDCVEEITPLMHKLLAGGISFLEEKHFQSDSESYSRNAIYIAPDNSMSIFALVWLPGQWTPVHDHGTWGVVGVYQGSIQERNFIRIDNQPKEALDSINLVPGGSVILTPGSVTSFVPNPDHIHITGNGTEKPVISLHLYGHAMSGFHIYDLENGTRKWNEVCHN